MTENPYNPLHPTTDPTHFFGRQDALAFFKRHLAGANNNHALLVIGQRGMGKSSLLSQIPLHIDERYLTVWLELSTIDLDDPVGLIAALVDMIRAAMETAEASTYRLPTFPDPTDSETNFMTWFAVDYLEVVMAAIRRQRHLVIMLDDTNLLLDAVENDAFPADFFDYLLNLLHTYERLDVVCTMDIRYEERALQSNLFGDSLLHYRLGPLLPDPALMLIREPVADYYYYEPAALQLIETLAGRHPFHIHSICRLLFRVWQERSPDSISLSEIDAVYTAALEQAGDVVSDLWTYARPNERLALTALLDLYQHNRGQTFPLTAIQDWLSNTDFPLTEVQLSAALRGLEYLGVIHTDENGHYDFVAGIQAEWLLRFTDIVPPEKTHRTWRDWMPPREVLAVIGAVLLIGLVLLLASLGDDNDSNSAANDDSAPPTSTLTTNASSTPEPTLTPEPTPLPTLGFRFGG